MPTFIIISFGECLIISGYASFPRETDCFIVGFSSKITSSAYDIFLSAVTT